MAFTALLFTLLLVATNAQQAQDHVLHVDDVQPAVSHVYHTFATKHLARGNVFEQSYASVCIIYTTTFLATVDIPGCR